MKSAYLDLRQEAGGSETFVYMSRSRQKSPENPILFFQKAVQHFETGAYFDKYRLTKF